jgi:hypothetical protein
MYQLDEVDCGVSNEKQGRFRGERCEFGHFESFG